MALVYRVAAMHRRQLLAHERAAASAMVRAYGEIWSRLQLDIEGMVARYYDALAAGEAVSEMWLFQGGRLTQLRQQVEFELARVMQYAEPEIIAQQRAAVEAAGLHTRQLVQAQAPGLWPRISASFAQLPTDAVIDLVGFLRNGSPLRALLDELGPAASASVQTALTQGIGLGYGPRKVARMARQALGGNMARALRISRTEMMRSYREATLRSYQSNSDVLDGWMWMAAKDGRTCVMCIAMDGTVHRLNERLDDHPNGRCTSVPHIRGVAMPKYETGVQWFANADPTLQRQVLGGSAYEAYQAGEVTLEDFIGRRRSRAWGTTRYAKSLRSILS